MVRILVLILGIIICSQLCYAINDSDSIEVLKREISYSMMYSSEKIESKILIIRNWSDVDYILVFSDKESRNEEERFRDIFLNQKKGIKFMHVMYESDNPECCNNILFYSFIKKIKPNEEFEIEIMLDSDEFNEDSFVKNNISFFKESFLVKCLDNVYERYLFPYNHITIQWSKIKEYLDRNK